MLQDLTSKTSIQMTNDSNYYRIVCKDLKSVLVIKVVKLIHQGEIQRKVMDMVISMGKSLDIDVYKEWLVKDLLENLEEVILGLEESLSEGEELSEKERRKAYSVLYREITKVYPQLGLEQICGIMNFKTHQLVNPEMKRISVKMDESGNTLNVIEFDGQEKLRGGPKTPKKRNPSLKRINDLEKYLFSKVIGQDNTIKRVMDYLKLKETGFAQHLSFFFVGKTGRGKTYLAECIADKYYDGRVIKVPCGAMSDKHEKSTLLGSPPGYVGSSEPSFLAQKAEISNAHVFIFDEIEKADDKLFDALLNLLDKGIIKDASGKDLDFKESIFIFTSNEAIHYKKADDIIGLIKDVKVVTQTESEIIGGLENRFRMEFLNRLDAIFVVNDLTRTDLEKIVRLELDARYNVLPTKDLIDYILDNADCTKFGARNIKRFIQNNIGVPLASAMLEKKISQKDWVKFYVDKGKLAFSQILDIK
jgi:ATP-dependent Clp protease ATP-binding subunit ClpA